MSVLIKGMDTPNHPQKITIEFINEGQVITSVGNFEYCEVPTPHGRLIDADKQWEVCKELVNDVLFPMDSIDEAEIVGMVKNARTVIESED